MINAYIITEEGRAFSVYITKMLCGSVVRNCWNVRMLPAGRRLWIFLRKIKERNKAGVMIVKNMAAE